MARLQTKNAGGSHHSFSQIIRHSLRDGFNAYGALSLGHGCLENISRINAVTNPYPRLCRDPEQPVFFNNFMRRSAPMRAAVAGCVW
jgi:hypothetical protein